MSKQSDEIKTCPWRQKSKNEVKKILDKKEFPCVFAKQTNLTDSINWLFCESNSNQRCTFLEGVIRYIDFIKNTIATDRILAPLVVLIENQAATLADEQKIGWEFIQFLIDNDTSEWLPDIPLEPNHHEWCLCFNGVQLFVNISSSKHKILKSRNLGSNLCLVINPREIFDIVAPLNMPKGKKIREKIRGRIEKYNGVPRPEELGFFGDKNNLEWKQYQLNENGSLKNEHCPLKINKEHK